MCGIAGIVFADSRPVDAERLADMIAAISHRGPDETRLLTQPGVGLAHARLSIIDIDGGRQPMTTDDGRLSVVFNGEIFNYLELRDELVARGRRFRTRSDTEVLLHLYAEYGDRLVEHLNGQWAFAIWDEPARRLFVSRDRLGVRPLFYTTAGGAFRFGSEIKALFADVNVPRRLDLVALDQLLTYWCTLPPRTMFEGVEELPPGHSMSVRDGRVEIRQYWQPSFEPMETRSEAEYVEELRALLADAVRLRLRSDVPVGAYLSGGLDSSVTSALAQRAVGGRLRTFSIAFDDPRFDESAMQRDVASWLRTAHDEVRCTSADIVRVLPDVVWHTETPLLRTAPAPLFLLSRAVRRAGFKVVVTGEGADEVFGGYDIFKEAKIRRFCAANPGSRRRPSLLRRLYPYLPTLHQQSDAYLQAFFKAGPDDRQSPFFSHMPRWTMTSRIKSFLTPDARAAAAAAGPQPPAVPEHFRSWDPFCQAQFLEMAQLLPGYILSAQGDRVALAHGVEARYPFLDVRVVEFASRLPTRLKMKVLNEKYVLKQAAAGLIPESVRCRAKQPYRAPDGDGFATTADYARELLAPETLQRDGVFRPEAVAALVRKLRDGRAIGVRDHMAVTAVLSTGLLLEQFVHRTRRVTHASVHAPVAPVHR